ncbi:ribosome maturation factor RimM [Hyphobacterium sp. HN65]|uniref:Ribosome maturation factor RimM n=1 Tax=Hyphobacterium lacteum TaxID=3116575 RepID=A0ABU7LTP4_9PROT|nr:ribosome maturation factor RimM [Hyphobacterium sp. HN65]MEE2527269.1 ribosome maturation factor RimM [Hyphobacterium sp. HN65]
MKPQLITIARIKGAHGVKGEARVQSFTADPAACFTYGPFLDRDGKPFLTPVKWRPQKDDFIVTFREALTREEVAALRGREFCVPRNALPEAGKDEFYITDLIGLRAVTSDGQAAGRVVAVENFGAGDLLEIEGDEGRFYVAFTRADVPDVDLAGGIVTIVMPDTDDTPENG